MVSASSASHEIGDPSPNTFYRSTLNSIQYLPIETIEDVLGQFKRLQDDWNSSLPIKVRKFILLGFNQDAIQCTDVIVIQEILKKVRHPSTKEMDCEIEAKIETLFQKLSNDPKEVIPDEYNKLLESFKEMISLEQIQMIMALVDNETTLSNYGKFQLLKKIRNGLAILSDEEENYNDPVTMGYITARNDIQLDLPTLSTIVKMAIPLIKKENCSDTDVEGIFKKINTHVKAFKPQMLVLLEATFPNSEQRFNFMNGLLIELKKIEGDEKKSRVLWVISLLIQTTIQIEDPNGLLDFLRKQLNLFSQHGYEKITKGWLTQPSEYRNDMFNLLKPQFKSPYDVFLVMIEWHSILTAKGFTMEVASDLIKYVQAVDPIKRDVFSSYYLALCSHSVEQDDPLFNCCEEEAILFLFLNRVFSFEELPKAIALILYDPPEEEPSSSNLNSQLGPKAPIDSNSITNYAKMITELLVQMPKEERICILTSLGYLFRGTSFSQRKELLEGYLTLFADHVQSASTGLFFNRAQQVIVSADIDVKKRYKLLLLLQPLLESLHHHKRILLLKVLETYPDGKYDPKKMKDLYQLKPLFTNANTLQDFHLLIEAFKRIPEDKKEHAFMILSNPNVSKPSQLALSIGTLYRAKIANERIFEAMGFPEVTTSLQELPLRVEDWEELSGYIQKIKPENKHLKAMINLFQEIRSTREWNPKMRDDSFSTLLQIAAEGNYPLKPIKNGFKAWMSLSEKDRKLISLFVKQNLSDFSQTLQHYMQYILADLCRHVFMEATQTLQHFISQLSKFEHAEWQKVAPLLAIIDQVDFFKLGNRTISFFQQNQYSPELKVAVFELMCALSEEDPDAIYELLVISLHIPLKERPLFINTAIALLKASKKNFIEYIFEGLFDLVKHFRSHSLPYQKLNQWMELHPQFPEQLRTLVFQRLDPLIPDYSKISESMLLIFSGILARDGEIETALSVIIDCIENVDSLNVQRLAIKLMIEYAGLDKKPDPLKTVERNWFDVPGVLRPWFIDNFGSNDDETWQFTLKFLNLMLLQIHFRDVKIGKQETQRINSLDMKQWQELVCNEQARSLYIQFAPLLQKIAMNKRKEVALLIMPFAGNIQLKLLHRYINFPDVLRNSARLIEDCSIRMNGDLIIELVASMKDCGEFLVKECLHLLKPLSADRERYERLKDFLVIQALSQEVDKKALLHLLVAGGYESVNILCNQIPPHLLSDFVRYTHLVIEGFKPNLSEITKTMELVIKGFIKDKELLFKRILIVKEETNFTARLNHLRLSEEVNGVDLFLVNDVRYFLKTPMNIFEVFSVKPVENSELHKNEYMDLFKRIVRKLQSKISYELMKSFLFYSMVSVAVTRKLDTALTSGQGLDRALQVHSAVASILLTAQELINADRIIPFLKLFHGYSLVNIEDALILLGEIDSNIISDMIELLSHPTKEPQQVLLILEAMADIPRKYHVSALTYIKEILNGRTPAEIALMLYLVRSIFEHEEDVEMFKMVALALVEDSHQKVRELVQIFRQIESEERVAALDFFNDYCSKNESVDGPQLLLALPK